MSDDTMKCPFCAETIKAEAKKCRYCGEFLPGHSRESILGDIDVGGDISGAEGVSVGHKAQAAKTGDVGGSVVQAQGDVTLGKALRDEQYQIALNWDGKANLRGFDLAKRDLSDAHLPGADLRGANLRKADLRMANLTGASLRGANLSKAELFEANVSKANLSHANVSKASLRKANLTGAYLRIANLTGANLRYANLTGANLCGARLLEAELEGAILYGADLRDCYHFGGYYVTPLADIGWSGAKSRLSSAHLRGAFYNKHTQWPAGFDVKATGAKLKKKGD